VLLVQREAEDTLRKAAQQAQARNQQMIDPDISAGFVENLRTLASSLDESTLARAVVLVSSDIRRLVWSLLVKTGLFYPVVSYQEIAPEFSVHTLATIQIPLRGDGSLLPPADLTRVPGLVAKAS
jgi:type III secretion protein V